VKSRREISALNFSTHSPGPYPVSNEADSQSQDDVGNTEDVEVEVSLQETAQERRSRFIPCFGGRW